MAKFHASYQCFNGCEGEYPLSTVMYNCPKCGGLLDVVHDIERLKAISGRRWHELFASRMGTTTFPYGSGVWRYKEMVQPNLPAKYVVSMNEGNTDMFWAEGLQRQLGFTKDLWVKCCGTSHSLSFKDLGMTVLVSTVKHMLQRGVPIKALACASTGDTSAALAAFGARAGLKTIVFLPSGKISLAQLIQPICHGAIVLSLDTDFDGCMKIVQEVTKDNTLYLANSKNSLRIEGQKTVGMEIIQQNDWSVPDWIIIPGGNLGNVSALAKGLSLWRELGIIKRVPRIAVAQAANAAPLYLSYRCGFHEKMTVAAAKTVASAIQIGNPVSYDKAVKALKDFNGVVEQATEQEIAEACARADLTGMITCPHTGVALAALFKLLENQTISKKDKVVVISTAHGLKFTEFKVGYHKDQLTDVIAGMPNKPIELEAKADLVKAKLEEILAKRQ